MKKHAIVLMAALVVSPAAVWAARLEFDPGAHFVMNGKRAFLLGVYDTGLGYTNDEASWEQTLFAPGGDVHNTRALGSIPLNMYLNYQFGAATISSMQALMNVLQRHGMMYFQTGNCFSHFSWTGGGFGIADQAYVQQFATNPGAAGYYIMDECEDSLLSETTQHNQQLHGWDPGGKTLAVLIADNREPSPWVNSADILGTDPYPLFGAEATTGYPHFLVADMTSRLRMVTPASKPIVSVLQLFKFTDNSRLPTFAEMRTHAIMSIVEGAQGIFWWELGVNGLRNQPNAVVSQWMGYLTTLVKELDSLQPVLLADPAPTALTGNSTLASDARAARVAQLRHNGDMIVNQNFFEGQWYYGLADQLAAGNTNGIFMLDKVAPIHTLTKLHNGNGYVFAYNYTNQTTPVTFTWYQNPIHVTEFSSGQPFALNGNQWSDTFGPYESRIYAVDMGGTGITPPPAGMTAKITSPAPLEHVQAVHRRRARLHADSGRNDCQLRLGYDRRGRRFPHAVADGHRFQRAECQRPQRGRLGFRRRGSGADRRHHRSDSRRYGGRDELGDRLAGRRARNAFLHGEGRRNASGAAGLRRFADCDSLGHDGVLERLPHHFGDDHRCDGTHGHGQRRRRGEQRVVAAYDRHHGSQVRGDGERHELGDRLAGWRSRNAFLHGEGGGDASGAAGLRRFADLHSLEHEGVLERCPHDYGDAHRRSRSHR